MRITDRGMFMEYDDFYEIEEIGSGGYGTVYTAKYKHKQDLRAVPNLVVLKQFKNFGEKSELFFSEVRTLNLGHGFRTYYTRINRLLNLFS